MKTYQEYKNQRLVESMPNLPDANDQQFLSPSREDHHQIQTLHRQIQGEFEKMFSLADNGQFTAASQVNQSMSPLINLIIQLNDFRSES